VGTTQANDEEHGGAGVMVGGNWVFPAVVVGKAEEGWMANVEMLAGSRRRLWEDEVASTSSNDTSSS
jgi:hypothetical protein